MLNVHKIFRGRKEMSEEDMRSGTVVGGAVALAEKLRADHAWDGRTLIAAPIAVLEMGAIVDNYWSVLGELKDVSFGASTLWARGDKELRVAIKLEDLKVFNFKGGEREEWRKPFGVALKGGFRSRGGDFHQGGWDGGEL